MDRLRDQKELTSDEAQAADLLAQARPIQVTPTQAARMRMRLDDELPGWSPRGAAWRRLALASCLLAGTALAAQALSWWNGRSAKPAAAPAPAPISAPTAPTVATPITLAPSDQSDWDGPDAALVVSAVQALRLDKDPIKAERLLVQYLALHPTGALEEEALALRIEAAAARNHPDAAKLAAKYLSAFPTGRYADVARKAKIRFSP